MKKFLSRILLTLALLVNADIYASFKPKEAYIINDLQINYFLNAHLEISIEKEWYNLFDDLDDTKDFDPSTLKSKFQDLQKLLKEKFKTYKIGKKTIHIYRSSYETTESVLKLDSKINICPAYYIDNEIVFRNTITECYKKNACSKLSKKCIDNHLPRHLLKMLKKFIINHYSWKSYLAKLELKEHELTFENLETTRPNLFIAVNINALKNPQDVYTLALRSCHINEETLISFENALKKNPSLFQNLLSGAVNAGVSLSLLYYIFTQTSANGMFI